MADKSKAVKTKDTDKPVDRMGDLQRFQMDARPNRVAALEVGQTYIECVRMPFDKATSADLKLAKGRLNSSLVKAISRAKARTNFSYQQESGVFQTESHDFMVYASVTRL